MKRRYAGIGAVSLSGLFLTGCLFHQHSVREPKPNDALLTGTSAVEQVASAMASHEESQPIPSPPAPPSDYHPRQRITRPASYSEPQQPSSPRATATAEPASMTGAEEKASLAAKATSETPLVAALRCALEKHPEEAQRLLEQYDKQDRELLLALLRLTAEVGEGELQNLSAEAASRTLEQLSTIINSLKKKAPLTLEKVCFCKKIQGFGRYTRCPQNHQFQAGSGNQPGERVQVYAEVRNFTCKQVEQQYETVLESRLVICDAERNELAKIDLGRCEDRSLTPRQDYFLNFQLHIPPKLAPGLYTLWLYVKDVTTEPARETSCSLDFRVVAPGAETTEKSESP